MKCLIYIEFSATPSVSYTKELTEWCRLTFPDMIVYDLDNFSEELVKQYALELLRKCKKAIVFFELTNFDPASGMLGFAERIFRGNPLMECILSKIDPYLIRLLDVYKINYVEAESAKQQQALIQKIMEV